MFNKKLYKVCSILFIFIMFVSVTSIDATMVPHKPGTGNDVDVVVNVAEDIWATVEIVVQVLSVAAIVFAGVRYMFASADGRADIKNQTIILVIGAVFVFGAVNIAGFIYKVANNIL